VFPDFEIRTTKIVAQKRRPWLRPLIFFEIEGSFRHCEGDEMSSPDEKTDEVHEKEMENLVISKSPLPPLFQRGESMEK
jgi:hypothetical protein